MSRLVSDLAGAELALWVGRATGADLGPDCDQGEYIITGGHSGRTMEVYRPHEDWAQGGPLIDRFGVDVCKDSDGMYWAEIAGSVHIPGSDIGAFGATRLEAAMRCIVRSIYGDAVSDEVAP